MKKYSRHPFNDNWTHQVYKDGKIRHIRVDSFLHAVLFSQEMSSLGDVQHLSQVKVEMLSGEKYDQIFVLFPNDLLMLSMSPRLSGYQYEVKLNYI